MNEPIRRALVPALERARVALQGAVRGGRPGRSAIRRAAARLRAFVHRLESLRSRRRLDDDVSEALLAPGRTIVADLLLMAHR